MCKSAVITGGGGEEVIDVDEVTAKRHDCRLLASTLYVLPSLATVGDREGETKKPPTKRDPVAAIAACAAADGVMLLNGRPDIVWPLLRRLFLFKLRCWEINLRRATRGDASNRKDAAAADKVSSFAIDADVVCCC